MRCSASAHATRGAGALVVWRDGELAIRKAWLAVAVEGARVVMGERVALDAAAIAEFGRLASDEQYAAANAPSRPASHSSARCAAPASTGRRSRCCCRCATRARPWRCSPSACRRRPPTRRCSRHARSATASPWRWARGCASTNWSTAPAHDSLTGLANRFGLHARLEAELARVAQRGGWRCCRSTSITSRTSTTRSATRPATNCCALPRSACSPACRPAPWWRGRAATSSSCCCPAPTRPSLRRGGRPGAGALGRPVHAARRAAPRRQRRHRARAGPRPQPRGAAALRRHRAVRRQGARGAARHTLFSSGARPRRARPRVAAGRAAPRDRAPRVRRALPAARAPGATGASSRRRRWCAGSTRSAACCCPARSSPWPRTTGLIEEIGPGVLDAACAQMAAWRRDGLRLQRISVNLSPRQLGTGRLAEARRARGAVATTCPRRRWSSRSPRA